MECEICDGEIQEENACLGEPGTMYEGKPVCETCYDEDERCAVVYYGADDSPHGISGTRNETDGDFRVGWHSIDASDFSFDLGFIDK